MIEPVEDKRSQRKRLLGMARAARDMRLPDDRRRAVAGIIRGAFAAEIVDRVLRAPAVPLFSESEVFECAYPGDPSGAQYWRETLQSGEADEAFARRLAAHLTIEELCRDGATFDNAVRLSLFESRLRECKDALAAQPVGVLQDRVRRIFENSDTRHLIPGSLRRALSPAPTEAAPTPPASPAEPVEAEHTPDPPNAPNPKAKSPAIGKRGQGREHSEKYRHVVAAMESIDRARLEAMLPKQMQSTFDAKRDMCKRSGIPSFND